MDDLRADGRPDPGGPPGRPDNLVVVLLDSLNRHLLGAYGGTEFATPAIDAFARPATAVHRPPHRVAALHAGPPRHPGRRPRLPVAAVGIDRGVGGRHHPVAAPRRGHDHAGVGPPPPLRDRRRELPHRLHRLGLRARPRERPVADHARPHVDGHARPARRAARRTTRLRRLPHLVPLRGGLPRAPDHAGGGRLDPDVGARTTTGSSSSSTSSTPTSRSTPPSPAPPSTTATSPAPSGPSGRPTWSTLPAGARPGAGQPPAPTTAPS